MTLDISVVEEDNRLETAATGASEALAQYRWHWTLDESNPDRVSMTEYAKQIARNIKTVYGHAKGYETWTLGGGAMELNEAIERAKVSNEKGSAITAIASARDISFTTARKSHPKEVKDVLEEAREIVSENTNTTIEEEVTVIAERLVKVNKQARKIEADRRARHGDRFIQVVTKVNGVKRYLAEIGDLMEGVDFDDEERELMAATLTKVQAAVGMLRSLLTGTTGADWDAELMKLTTSLGEGE